MRGLCLACGAVGLLGASQCTGSLRRVEDVPLVTTDIDNFWAAYPAATRDTAQAYRVFREQYFGKASVGLADYFRRKYRDDARLFARRITLRPRYYASVRAGTLAVADQKPRILRDFRRLQALYPAVRFSPIYFVVGGFAGSTAQPPGLLIGADQTSGGPGVDASELTLVQRNRNGAVADLPRLVTHEMIHNSQQRHTGSLLSAAIREGMADFVAELVTGTLGTNAHLHAYGNAHEAEIWRAFRQEMNGSDQRNWLANPAQETADKPCDLGYYVGYKICESYYNSQADTKQALADMLATKNFAAFLQQSGYAAKMGQP